MIVGLTGNIGSGKSFVAHLFAKKGVPVYNSDDRAKFLMTNDPELIKNITQIFESKAYINNQLNRAYIAQRIFGNKHLLEKMNATVHPAVQFDFERWVDKNKNAPFVIKEAAILIESGAYKQCNKLILVQAPVDIRKERIRKRDNMSEEQISQRMANQMQEKEKIKYADFLINNDGIAVVQDQVNKIYNQLTNTIA